MIPNTYRRQNGCYNCEKCFIKSEYDDENLYYCTMNAPKRPPCMSVLMDEYESSLKDEKKFHDMYEEWEVWVKDRNVSAWGICDSWEKRKEES
jgi:hypothetical protein